MTSRVLGRARVAAMADLRSTGKTSSQPDSRLKASSTDAGSPPPASWCSRSELHETTGRWWAAGDSRGGVSRTCDDAEEQAEADGTGGAEDYVARNLTRRRRPRLLPFVTSCGGPATLGREPSERGHIMVA